MRKMVREVALSAVALSAALLLPGCGCTPSTPVAGSDAGSGAGAVTVSDRSAGSEAASQEAATQIGEGDTTVEVTNETGADVVELAVRPAGADDFDKANSFSGFRFAQGSTVELSFTAAGGEAPLYDVMLIRSDNVTVMVRDIDLENLADLAFHYDNGIGYASYTDASSGETTDNEEQATETEQTSDDGGNYDLENQAG